MKVASAIEQSDDIRFDNEPEFVLTAIRGGKGKVGVKTLYIKPGNPSENSYNESFIGELENVLLTTKIFILLPEVQVVIERWRHHDNTKLPHSNLG